MYKRNTNSGHDVVWNPEHTDLAEQAMKEMQEEGGVPLHVTLPEDANVPLESDVAAQVKERYKYLVREQDLDEAIRAALDAQEEAEEDGDEEALADAEAEADRLKRQYQEHTGEEWQE